MDDDDDSGGFLLPFTGDELLRAMTAQAGRPIESGRPTVNIDGKPIDINRAFTAGELTVNEYRALVGLPPMPGPAGEARERQR